MVDCKHMVTMSNEEGVSTCQTCGEKVHAVETRICGGCGHYGESLFNGGLCRKHFMRVPSGMYVTYKIKDGTCLTPKVENKDD